VQSKARNLALWRREIEYLLSKIAIDHLAGTRGRTFEVRSTAEAATQTKSCGPPICERQEIVELEL